MGLRKGWLLGYLALLLAVAPVRAEGLKAGERVVVEGVIYLMGGV